MKIKVFISWSGERSKKVAKELYKWVPRVLQSVEPWMSDEDIKKGDRWSEKIGQSLQDHTIGIICVTPENMKSEWLLFEAGAISKTVGQSKVYPLLLGMNSDSLKGPLSIFQSTIFKKEDIYRFVESLNEMLGSHKVSQGILVETFEDCWPKLEKAINDLSKSEFEFDSTSLPDLLDLFSNSDLPKPSIESNAFFSEGFESYSLYEIITTIAKKKLYNYSRLNRKILDKEYWTFLETIPKKIENGFDFKLLFLDPDAPDYVILAAHSDKDFRDQLKSSINTAIKIFEKYGINHQHHCRTYQSVRSMAITIVDDAVLFAPVRKNDNGNIQELTKSSFDLIHAKSQLGTHLVSDFLLEWQNGQKLKAY